MIIKHPLVLNSFVIKYDYIIFSKTNKHQRFVTDLRINVVNLEHTCQLNVSSLCESLKLSGLSNNLHREQTAFALELLRNNPACESLHLQPHLEKVLPN